MINYDIAMIIVIGLGLVSVLGIRLYYSQKRERILKSIVDKYVKDTEK